MALMDSINGWHNGQHYWTALMDGINGRHYWTPLMEDIN
jgi:hypothetical protein